MKIGVAPAGTFRHALHRDCLSDTLGDLSLERPLHCQPPPSAALDEAPSITQRPSAASLAPRPLLPDVASSSFSR
jgi:hypothetical protein